MTRISARSSRRAAVRPAAGAAALSAACLAALAALPVSAQSAASVLDVRWQPWYGCWAPAADLPGATADGPVTCVSPAGGSAVDITTVAGGRVSGRQRLVADGVARPVERDGCQGTERATWSADGRRVYLHSESACANNVTRSGDGVLAFAATGDWLDVRAASIGGYTGVRSVRYEPALAPAALPADVATALADRATSATSARLAASAPVGTAAVVEATRAAGGSVTGAWLAELRQRFAPDARQLVALAGAGVPGAVTDVMIATSNPQVFAVGPSGAERALGTAPRTGRQIPLALTYPGGGLGWGWDGFGWGPGNLGYAYGRGGYGYGAYGYANGFYPGGFWGAGPVVVVRPAPSAPAGQGGAIIRGRGYTQGDAATAGSARGSGATAPSDGGRGSVSSGGGYSSGGSSGGSSSSGSSGSVGTAKPRP